MATLKELTKLPPEERIKRLKELQQKQVDITDLFKEEEATLEQRTRQAAKEAPKLSEEEIRQYGNQLAREKSLDELSRNIYAREQTIHDKGYANPNDAQDLKIAAYAMRRKEQEYQAQGMIYEARKASRTQEEVEHLLNVYMR